MVVQNVQVLLLIKTSFAARSAFSFHVISLWLGIQQNVMNLLLDDIS